MLQSINDPYDVPSEVLHAVGLDSRRPSPRRVSALVWGDSAKTRLRQDGDLVPELVGGLREAVQQENQVAVSGAGGASVEDIVADGDLDHLNLDLCALLGLSGAARQKNDPQELRDHCPSHKTRPAGLFSSRLLLKTHEIQDEGLFEGDLAVALVAPGRAAVPGLHVRFYDQSIVVGFERA